MRELVAVVAAFAGQEAPVAGLTRVRRRRGLRTRARTSRPAALAEAAASVGQAGPVAGLTAGLTPSRTRR